MLSKELMTASIKLISQMYKNEDIMVDNKAMEDFIRSQKV